MAGLRVGMKTIQKISVGDIFLNYANKVNRKVILVIFRSGGGGVGQNFVISICG